MPSLKVNFKTPEKASEFSKNFGVVGLKSKIKVDGSSVTITSPDTKTHNFVKQMVADLKSEAKMESVLLGLLDTIVEVSKEGSSKEVVLLDESRVSIDSVFASNFIKIHDSMEESGQSMLRLLAVESSESFNKAKEFVNKEQE